MKVVFIAGPFRADTTWAVECNVRRAEELALAVALLGAMPLCPHANTRFFDGLCTDDFWLDGTRELLKRCDAIALVDGWERSFGSCAERECAVLAGMPIFDARLRGLAEWARRAP